MSPNKLLYKLVSNKLETFKISEIVLIIDIQLTPSNSARLVPSEIGSRLDASNQASGVRLLKCTTRGKREGEGERYRQRTTALIGGRAGTGIMIGGGRRAQEVDKKKSIS